MLLGNRFVWIARGLSLSGRVRYLEERWPYFFAFGLPSAAICTWGSGLANAALFALLFPAVRTMPNPCHALVVARVALTELNFVSVIVYHHGYARKARSSRSVQSPVFVQERCSALSFAAYPYSAPHICRCDMMVERPDRSDSQRWRRGGPSQEGIQQFVGEG